MRNFAKKMRNFAKKMRNFAKKMRNFAKKKGGHRRGVEFFAPCLSPQAGDIAHFLINLT